MYLVCGSYALRSAVGIFLFIVSANGLPLFRSLQSGDGFWKFAPDAPGYHAHALSALREGVCAGWIGAFSAIDLFGALVGWIYWWFIPHPLFGILLNVWAATGTVLLAFAIGRDLGGSNGTGLAAAGFVAFWPSTLIWSAQLLREPMFLFLLFLVFYLTARLFSLEGGGRGSAAVILAGIVIASFLIAKSRAYSGLVLLGSFVIVGLRNVIVGWRRRLSVCCAVAMGLGAWGGITLPVWIPVPSGVRAGGVGGSSVVACEKRVAQERAAPGGLWPPSMWLKTLGVVQKHSLRAGGSTRGDATGDISTPIGLIRQVPATIAAAIFSPYPWRWFSGSSTGFFRSLAGLEVCLLALLVPSLVVGSSQAAARGSFVSIFMLIYGMVIWFLVALVVANEGSLFRLRLQGVLPVLVVSISGGGLRLYGRVWERIALSFGARKERPVS